MINTEELLNSLNAQTHHAHHKSENLLDPSLLKDNQFTSELYAEEPPQPPQFFVEMLNEQKKKKLIGNQAMEAISQAKKQKQKNAYLAYNEGQLAYLGLLVDLSKNRNQSAHKMVTDAITKRLNKVNYDLEGGNIYINRDRAIKKKEQIQLLEEMDVARLLKIKEGNIRSKLQFLNYKMQQMEKIDAPLKQKPEEIPKKIEDSLSVAEYKLGSEKTQIANEYVKHMTQQRKLMRKRQRQRKFKERREEEKRIAELKELQNLKQKQKRSQIVQRMKDRKKKMLDERKQVAQKEQKVQKFLTPYRKQKPLFKRRFQQYQEKVLESERYHQEKLREYKERKKAYSLSDMVEHQKKYSVQKVKEKQKKKQQKQMYQKSLKIHNKVYFRGSIHEVVQQVDKEVKERDISLYQIGLGKEKRRQKYSQKVYEDHKPKIDQEKRKQLLQAIENEELKKRKLKKSYKQMVNESGQEIGLQSFYEELSPQNHSELGNKYLEYAKLKKKRVENVEMNMDQEIQKREETVKALKKEQHSREKNADKDLWVIRSKQMEQMTKDIASPKEFQQIKLNYQNFDEIAAKRQKVLKHANLPLDDHLSQKNALDNFYLESIKNKIKLLQ